VHKTGQKAASSKPQLCQRRQLPGNPLTGLRDPAGRLDYFELGQVDNRRLLIDDYFCKIIT